MTVAQAESPTPNLHRLLAFLERDPANRTLLADAATAAFEDQAYDIAAELLIRYAAQAPLPNELKNLQGLIALSQSRFADAAAAFEALLNDGAASPALRFNLAWAKAMDGDYQGAYALLGDATIATSPRAPSLKIQMMHHLGLLDEALAAGDELAKRYPGNEALMGALATLAMDADRADLARKYAAHAGANPEGRAALGLLTLGEHDPAQSLPMFDDALKAQPNNARAWMGKGLALLSMGDAKAGTLAIDKGAELFGDHIGSWIASGWAHFVGGDIQGARASFERALRIDDNFGESHGGLAVVELLSGNLDNAQRETEIALRLDKNSFGAALAKSLLLERSGQKGAAQKIRDIALNTPIGIDGKTIAQALLTLGGQKPKR